MARVIDDTHWFGSTVTMCFDFWDSVKDLADDTVYTPSNSAYVDAIAHELVLASATQDYVEIGTGIRVNLTQPFTLLIQQKILAFNVSYPGIIRLRSDATSAFVAFASGQSSYNAISLGSRDGATQFHRSRIGYNEYPNEASMIDVYMTFAYSYQGSNPNAVGSYSASVDGNAQSIISNPGIAAGANTSSIIGLATNTYTDARMSLVTLSDTFFTSGLLNDLTSDPFQFLITEPDVVTEDALFTGTEF